jgi:photosystem II stability/assembly factor-like uncharacterized protein
MKDLKLFYFLTFILILLPGKMIQSQWTWQNPLPTSATYRGCFFTDDSHGWIVGDGGCILKTIDSGTSWQCMTSGIESDLYAVYFVNNDYGWAVGANSVIIKTSDGGESWKVQKYIGQYIYITSVYFSDTLNGWTDGGDIAGQLYHTVDGGDTWNSVFISGAKEITEIFFTDSLHGWAGTYDDQIFSTTNGGASWTGHSTPYWPHTIFFLNQDTGWMSYYGGIYRTIDGANTWQEQAGVGEYNDISSIQFIDQDHGWAVGEEHMMKTSDGGNNWSDQSYDRLLFSIFMTDFLNGWAVGGWYGDLLHTTDGGATWEQQRQGITGDIVHISFSGYDYGIAVPLSYSYDVILESHNGGSIWSVRQITDDSTYFINVFQLDQMSAWICGKNGTIYHTGNSGGDWEKQYTGHPELFINCIQFLSETDGFAVGFDTTYSSIYFLSTIDGGNSWSMGSVKFDGIATALCFTDKLNGYIGANDYDSAQSYILITRNGGESWEQSELLVPMDNDPQSIQFLNDSAGFMCTRHSILKTTDFGESWESLLPGQNYYFESAYFTDILNGWAVGFDLSSGVILRTNNGGVDWENVHVECDNHFYDVFFLDSANGWVSGHGGTILRWGNGPPVVIKDHSKNDPELNFKISPNPCDKYTNLSFELKNEVCLALSIYDLEGKMLYKLVDHKFAGGKHVIPIIVQNIPTGLYIFKISTGKESSSGKIIILH